MSTLARDLPIGDLKTSDHNLYQPEFTGTGWEYFKIWIVNLFLTICTLGVYSAWAKVRTKHYFYSNTWLAGSAFDYLASPVTILKGRLIAVGLFGVYYIVSQFGAQYALVLAGLFLLATPWLVVKSLTFRLGNIGYRNLRFRFEGRYGEAAKVYILYAILAVIPFFVPFFVHRQSRFHYNNAGFGDRSFEFTAWASHFYQFYITASFLAVICFVLLAIGIVPPIQYSGLDESVVSILVAVMGVGIYYAFFVYIKTATLNTIWSNIQSGHSNVVSTLKTLTMIWLYISNAVAIVLTAGLFIPWAKVRLTKYRISRVQLHYIGDLGAIGATEAQKLNATSEGVSEMFDMDLGI